MSEDVVVETFEVLDTENGHKEVVKSIQEIKPADGAKPPVEIMEAVKNRMLETLSCPITARSLVELEELAKLARRLLAVCVDPLAQPRNGLVGTGFYVGGGDSGLDSNGYSAGYNGVLAPSSPAETFGVKALKELIANLREIYSSNREATVVERKCEDLISAISIAKERGDTELTRRLEDKLLGSFDEVKAPDTKPANGLRVALPVDSECPGEEV